MTDASDAEVGEPAPQPDASTLDNDALARFTERLRPSRRFYANPAEA